MNATPTLPSILADHGHNLALVIGNGVNRHDAPEDNNSWSTILAGLAGDYGLDVRTPTLREGMSLTELYDLLDLSPPPASAAGRSLQEQFCDRLQGWVHRPHHERIITWARARGAPVLTTNFDDLLARAGGCRLLPPRVSGFTDYYPWGRYYGDAELADPTDGFGIWHINGMRRYRRSVRLGLSHYMGSVQRVRDWLHEGKPDRLFDAEAKADWPGATTWLHVLFNMPFVMFGLALDENEVFLRWLLIERRRYVSKFPQHHQPGWYVYPAAEAKPGKLRFLEGMGVTPVQVTDHAEIYAATTWELPSGLTPPPAPPPHPAPA